MIPPRHPRFHCLVIVLVWLIAGCHSKQSRFAAVTPSPVSSGKHALSPTPEAPQPSSKVERPNGPVRFVDATQSAGIHFVHYNGAFGKKYLPETMGSGVCVLDYDNDGWQDILFVNSADWPDHKESHATSALYHNNGDGTFTDVTRGSGLGIETYGMGCAVGDFDNDGRDDVLITALNGNHLFHNLGAGKFRDVTGSAGVGDPGFATGAVWFDFDNDGKLDLFIAHYVNWSEKTDQFCSLDGKQKSYCTPEVYKGESSSLFRNLGNGRFEDVTKKAGLYDPSSKALGVVLLDYDNDGWLDLLVTNDTQANKLYRNNHNGTFTESAFAAGVAFSDAGKARAGMGADAVDFDRSGKQGIVIGDFTNEGIALYQNEGGGLFSDVAASSGIAAASAPYLTFSTFFFDFDLDGLPDIFAANGHVADDVSTVQPSVKYAESPLLFRNLGSGRFENVTNRVGPALRQPIVGRGAAYLDFDGDGDLDLLITTSSGPSKLLRNDNGNANDMLRIKLIGTKSNRDAIGAHVTVRRNERLVGAQMVKSGSSYLSQSEFPLTFGLGRARDEGALEVEVLWPSGKKEKIRGLAPNHSLIVQEGKGIIQDSMITWKIAPSLSRGVTQ